MRETANANHAAHDAALAAGDRPSCDLLRLGRLAKEFALARLEANALRNAAKDALRHARGVAWVRTALRGAC